MTSLRQKFKELSPGKKMLFVFLSIYSIVYAIHILSHCVLPNHPTVELKKNSVSYDKLGGYEDAKIINYSVTNTGQEPIYVAINSFGEVYQDFKWLSYKWHHADYSRGCGTGSSFKEILPNQSVDIDSYHRPNSIANFCGIWIYDKPEFRGHSIAWSSLNLD